MFHLHTSSSLGRHGQIITDHGVIETPAFFPVGTGGAMRGITLEELREIGADILLCNTYHLHLRPGEQLIQRAGGLHTFIGWDRPILTDSGGFQVFSLSKMRTIDDAGATFQSHIDGSTHFIGPAEAMAIQHTLGSDIIMCLDECVASTAPRATQIEAVERTLLWGKQCKDEHQTLKKRCPERSPLLFGIVQGGLERDLRAKCAEELVAIGFDGYAVGGLAVGETQEEMYGILDCVCPLLPADAPRYLMGVGKREQHEEAVRRGIDLFDCVLPMREARHGKIHLTGQDTIDIRKAIYAEDCSVIDPRSSSPLSRTHSKAYLHYLFRADERSAETIACMQNLSATLANIGEIRDRIRRS